mmetsp:Transcript_78929/g.231676  ORF Transcript_78929/g.231676 Transcript_78929/m.231676 type:complete len:255 (-) Transcript_78929:42-806(-)
MGSGPWWLMTKSFLLVFLCERRTKATNRVPQNSWGESSATSTKPKFMVCQRSSLHTMTTAPATGLAGPTVRQAPFRPASWASLSTRPTSLHSWKPITSKGSACAALAMSRPALLWFPLRWRKRFHQKRLYVSVLTLRASALGEAASQCLRPQPSAGTPAWHQWLPPTVAPDVCQPIAPGSGLAGPSGCGVKLGWSRWSICTRHAPTQPAAKASTAPSTARPMKWPPTGAPASESEEEDSSIASNSSICFFVRVS